MDSSPERSARTGPTARSPAWPQRHIARLQQHAAGLTPTVRGLLWAAGSGLVFSQLNALMRLLARQLDPFQTQFLRYLFGMLVMVPLILRGGWRSYIPQQIGPQF